MFKQIGDFIAARIDNAIKNPHTTTSGLGVWATIPALPSWPAKVGAFITGLGLVLAHDGDKGSSKPTERVNDAVEKVEGMK